MRHVPFLDILFAGQLEGLINGHANHAPIGILGVQVIPLKTTTARLIFQMMFVVYMGGGMDLVLSFA
jgi:hypothetical protein